LTEDQKYPALHTPLVMVHVQKENLSQLWNTFWLLSLVQSRDEPHLHRHLKSIRTNNLRQPRRSHHMFHQGIFIPIKDFHLQVIFYKFINFHVVSI